MQTKKEIWADIQQIMQKDYSGCINQKDNNHPEKYVITNDMSDQEFEETIQDYLLDFKDGHLGFWSVDTETPFIGFSVRRYEDALYVTKKSDEKRVKVGDKIKAIDNKGIEELAKIHWKRLEDQVPERQWWGSVLSRATAIQVERNTVTFDMPLSHYEPIPYQPIYACEQLTDTTVYMQLTDFAQEAPIRDLIEENSHLLEKSNSLIIDVRTNHGGNDFFYSPLLQYVFPEELTWQEMFKKDEVMFTNYTDRNCALLIEAMSGYLEQPLDSEAVVEIQSEIEQTKSNWGKGFLEISEEGDQVIAGGPFPKQVYILSDCYCGSSGDTFVANAKKSSKVTVVGRPTMGIVDYCNVVTADYGAFSFQYSVSKMNDPYFTNKTGVLPDVYIPWTPEHLKEDRDMKRVWELIESKENTDIGNTTIKCS